MPHFLRFLGLGSISVLLCGISVSPKAPPNQGGEREKQAKVSGPEITRLVEQLGSMDFAEREKATKALEAIGLPALDALRKAAQSTDAEVARRATRLWEAIDFLDLLLADYRSYGLPLPADDAKLVRFDSGSRYYVGFKLMPNFYLLGFLLRPETKETPALLLIGTQEYRLESRKPIEYSEPKPELVKSIRDYWWDDSPFMLKIWLPVALQCKARGWDELAKELWTFSLKNSYGLTFQPEELPNRAAVTYLAWGYSKNELAKPDTDRAKTAKRMKAVLAAEPSLNTEENQALLKSLETTLVPSTAKPGTVQRMIDDLTDMCDKWFWSDHRYLRLAQRGFEAVPALIEHLNDHRLTRSVNGGFGNWKLYNIRVNEVVSHILQDLAGGALGQPGSIRAWPIEKAAAQAWWDKVRKEGGEAHVLSHVLPSGDKVEGPNSLMLDIIKKNYPQHLPKLYKTILNERPKVLSQDIAEAVAKSSLPLDGKRELFFQASRSKILEHRRYGLTHLQKLDPKEFMTILLATLESWPKTPTEPSASLESQEAGFAHLVSGTDDARAWKMLEKVAKRSDVGLRMEIIWAVGERSWGERQRQLCLDFLKTFLDDASTPNFFAKPNKSFPRGPQMFFMFNQLNVRKLAAMKIDLLMGKPVQLKPNITPEKLMKMGDEVKKLMDNLKK